MAHTDRDALVALYNATGGANWKQKTNWDTGVDLSQWCGIKVDEQGRVVELNLFWNNLQGITRAGSSTFCMFSKYSLTERDHFTSFFQQATTLSFLCVPMFCERSRPEYSLHVESP